MHQLQLALHLPAIAAVQHCLLLIRLAADLGTFHKILSTIQTIDDAPARAPNLNSRVQVHAKISPANVSDVSEHDVSDMAETKSAASASTSDGGFATF